MIYWRDKGWFGLYYIGGVALIGCCAWFTFGNPDNPVWYGLKDNEARLYETKLDAENDEADDIENVHRTFKIWFGLFMINLICMIIIGIPRHWHSKFEKNKVVSVIYYICALWWLVMWGLGLHFRFQEAGRAVCRDRDIACAYSGEDSRICPDSELRLSDSPTLDETLNIQKASCSFMKYYLDIAGLLIGGYAAWFILGLTGATKTPVWTPKSFENNDG